MSSSRARGGLLTSSARRVRSRGGGGAYGTHWQASHVGPVESGQKRELIYIKFTYTRYDGGKHRAKLWAAPFLPTTAGGTVDGRLWSRSDRPKSATPGFYSIPLRDAPSSSTHTVLGAQHFLGFDCRSLGSRAHHWPPFAIFYFAIPSFFSSIRRVASERVRRLPAAG